MDPNIQIVLTVGVPTLAVLLSSVINNSRLTDLRIFIQAEVGRVETVLRAELKAESAAIRLDIQRLDQWVKVIEERAGMIVRP